MKIITVLILMIGSFCYSQNDSTYYYFDRVTPVESILSKIDAEKSSSLKNYFRLIYFSKLRQLDSIEKYISILEKDNKLPKNKKIKLLYFTAYFHRISQNDSLSFIFHTKALNLAKTNKDTLTILSSLSGLAQSYDYNDDNSYRLDYLNKLEEKAKLYNSNSHKIIYSFLKGNYYLFRDENKKAAEYYNKTLQFKFKKRDSAVLINTLNSLGVLYEVNIEIPDSAIFFYNKKLQIINSNKALQYPSNYFTTYMNIGNSYLSKNDLKHAEHYYLLADSITLLEHTVFYKSMIKENLSRLYAQKKNYKAAYSHLLEYNKLSDSIKLEEQREGIARIKEEFDNEKLRADNLESEAKRKQNRNLLIAALALLLFGGITAFLIQKNTRRKQKLAEQEKALETQKLATVLKEQELTAIDAMIEGQEKERQRIANDLHDDLGGLMATVKLHFNALKDKNSPELFNKTNQLIDEAYNKVRTVAHAKNSGVIAKQGLLKAVEHMAEKISASNKITIDVIDHGLDDRLENSLELTLFRIIQELVANIIKHAEASEATIHLTNHEDTLNIMVEDNGKGFNTSQITTKHKGMGISSIDKRIEHLNGKMIIESEIKKGTTIIIDIPI
ncbi:tetratricopeptide repeat-containing sensor histidine kinase [Ichthyenterobacterium magnum]|uniref:Oxygen sensor histidine kinase NreB n=1 Tax=Ichthyenterobacterium magnum TaxID=1230530 RepID=A0A420DEM5_9FLAO|nr:sensor histidine kinase [Ichthyenterobacterium magnum]RKE90830.1 hypothetical protein BXY80_2673 [Ichthyenterobacterium magnum]